MQDCIADLQFHRLSLHPCTTQPGQMKPTRWLTIFCLTLGSLSCARPAPAAAPTAGTHTPIIWVSIDSLVPIPV
jgi:hypothetical protein